MPFKHCSYRTFAPLFMAVLLLTGCETRSISNAGYPGSTNALYRGELADLDVLGVQNSGPITDEHIADTLVASRKIAPRPDEPILVVQSGAQTPDSEFLTALDAHFTIGTFSGIPPQSRDDFARKIRLIAAQGGYGQILCYWGTLESAKTNEVTKAVSWVPIAGWLLPDQTQKMRIALRAVLIDVQSGNWRMYRPVPLDDEQLSAIFNRRGSDQDQVVRLKQAGYTALAHDLIESAG
ncbi:MAG TPA: hypothetical protein VGV37_01570 [Aliidongia sp.]|uniref:hypothetical protein n=1 Tax=Aliidongia sp. TaxID=1914230 RepID=UPI002DDDAC6F|nr:hypothetical protein [Aliidongia sp.]HEV2673198.1 hypothetical protein [Aliidongia sp.]